MICAVIGLMNSGKTLFMTYKLWLAYLTGKTIITNYNLNFPYYKNAGQILKINRDYLENLGKDGVVLTNCAIGLDELHIYLDSRGGSNRILTYFFTQSSKDDTEIYFTTQHIGQIDKRLRDNMHNIVSCSRVLNKDGKPIPINEEQRFLSEDQQKILYIKGVEFKKKTIGFMAIVKHSADYYIKSKPIFKLYDTKQKISMSGGFKNERNGQFNLNDYESELIKI